MPPHPLTNSEIQNYCKNEPRFNGIYSRDNLTKTIKNRAYVINVNEYVDIGKHWIALYASTELHSKNNEVIYFDSFGKYIPKEIKKFIGQKTSKQTYLDYKIMIQSCVDTFVSNSSILCLLIKN